MNETVQLVTNKTDQEKANEYRETLIAAMDPVLKILTDASRDGLVIQLGFGANAFKQVVLTQLVISKIFE